MSPPISPFRSRDGTTDMSIASAENPAPPTRWTRWTRLLPKSKPKLAEDRRQQLGAWLFLLSLVVFFISTILLYAIFAYSRRDDPQSNVPLPSAFLISTGCLVVISGLVHWATRSVRRDRFERTSNLLWISTASAVIFMGVQLVAMANMLRGPGTFAGSGRGMVGMVVVLAVLHALHVAGGVIALALVAVRARKGLYDHERHFPVDFAAQYWHFLDAVWICMLIAFYFTTGGF